MPLTKPYSRINSLGQSEAIEYKDLIRSQPLTEGTLWSALISGGIPSMALPDPLRLSDGTVTAPVLSWSNTNDLQTGRYRIGNNNVGESVAGALKYDWNASRLLLASGFDLQITGLTATRVLFAGASKEIKDDGGLTYVAATDALTIAGYALVGTAIDANAAGDLSAGLTGAARMWYDQSAAALYLYGGATVNHKWDVAATGNATFTQSAGTALRFLGQADTYQATFECTGVTVGAMSLDLVKGAGGTGDVSLGYLDGESLLWSIGHDTSESKFAIAYQSGFGPGADRFRITADGGVEIPKEAALDLLELSPAQITADQNDYNPGNGSHWRLNSDAARTITGIVPRTTNRLLFIVNVGAQNIVLANQNAGSAAANRIITGTGADVTLAADDTAILLYDATTARWRIYG